MMVPVSPVYKIQVSTTIAPSVNVMMIGLAMSAKYILVCVTFHV
jgi:hypothetical protein